MRRFSSTRDDAEKRRRILWVFPGFGVGGAQARFAAIANHFGPASTHIILSLNGDLACRQKLAADLDLAFPDPGHRPGHMLAAIRQARFVLRAQEPDLVVTSNWGAIEWAIGARLAGLPHLHTEDGFGPEERAHQIPRRVLTRRIALRGSLVVVPSRTLQAVACEIWRLSPGRVRCIPNGIDLARFAAATPATLPPGHGPVIGTVAALRPEKNLARLIRAFAALRAERRARLVIVGDGPERPALEQLARFSGVAEDVVFAGQTAQPETWYARFDVFALSSDTEQMPLSLLEAMAAGLPAVCTDVGDVRAMLSEANARFVTALDDTRFATSLANVLDSDFRALGSANRQKAEREFDDAQMFAAHGQLLGL
jgi:glycosyltransferase involved in cell wall biosynthesis